MKNYLKELNPSRGNILRIRLITAFFLFCSPIYITGCKTDRIEVKSVIVKSPLMYDQPGSIREMYYDVRDGKETNIAIYAGFHNETLYDIQISRNSNMTKTPSLSGLSEDIDADEQLLLFNQILSHLSQSYTFDNVKQIIIFTRDLRRMSVEILEKYNSHRDYIRAIKESFFFFKLFDILKSYGINIKEIEVNDIYWLAVEDKNQMESTKDNKWNDINLDATIYLTKVSHPQKSPIK